MKTKINFMIKKADQKDISQIVKIHKKCILTTNSKFYSNDIIKEWTAQISSKNITDQFKNSSWYVLIINNKIIGFTQFSIKNNVLYQINITPSHQRKNYGKLLYQFIEEKFKKNKIEKIHLNSTLNAFKFYKNLGFKSLGKIKFKLNKKYVQMIKMEKIINYYN